MVSGNDSEIDNNYEYEDVFFDTDSEPEITPQPLTQIQTHQVFCENTETSLSMKYSNISSGETILELADNFIDIWTSFDLDNFVSKFMNECGIHTMDMFNQQTVHDKYTLKLKEVLIIKQLLKKFNADDTAYPKNMAFTYSDKLDNVFSIIGNMMHTFLSLRQCMMGKRQNHDSSMSDDIRILNVKLNRESEDMKVAEKLRRYTLNWISKMGYRRYGEDVYKPVYYQGYYTHAWELYCSIEEFVNRMVNKDTNTEIWRALYDNKGYITLIQFLKICQEYEFPDLKPDRTVFSFKNGVYLADTHEFFDYETSSLSHDIVACKFFTQDFDYCPVREKWNTIETPGFQIMMDTQFKEEEDYVEICKTAFILLGRMLYDLGTHEDWQVIPFFKGFAHTGKSTILKSIINKFYNPEDVGTLSNKCERNFPVGSLYDKKIFTAMDINKDFNLDQMMFQSMVSGEPVAIARKFKDPRYCTWTSPGAMSGNEFFGYTDNGGSLGRRVVLFEFLHRLTTAQKKVNVEEMLNKEIGNIIQKCNLAYREAASTYSRQDIWAHLPVYFHRNRDELLEQTNSLLEYLKSDNVEFNPEYYIQKDEFVNAFNQHCKGVGLKPKKFCKDYYSSPFAEVSNMFNIKVSVKKSPTINGIKLKGTFIVGVRTSSYSNVPEEF
jgi:hypothetical protein